MATTNSEGFSTSEIAAEIGVHPATLKKWLSTGQLREPRRIKAGGCNIRVWTRADLARARALKAAHGAAALEVKTTRLLKLDKLRRQRAKGTKEKS
jgi:DNA-binding transcriptional MerR regulator